MFKVIKNFLKKPDLDAESWHQRELQQRRKAEQEVLKQYRLRPLQRWLFLRDLRRLRLAIKHRESMRLARTRMFGLYRDIYREIGQQLAFYQKLNHGDDIFYLTVEELDAYHEGRSVCTDLALLADLRRKTFKDFQSKDTPDHFTTKGTTYFQNTIEKEKIEAPVAVDGSLTGIGCYPGVVTAPAKVIFNPDDADDIEGQILCTIRTDPGWAPLFPTCGGLLIERGSTLSHSAIVARELGIPAVVGVAAITEKISSGSVVTIDGEKGKVWLQKNGTQTPTSTDEVSDSRQRGGQ